MNSKRAVRCFVGLGSNLKQPRRQLGLAIDALRRLADCRVIAVSSCYRSKPMGPSDQPDYLNAVVELATTLEPEALLDALQAIEAAQGRLRSGERWGPRTLDLDLLFYGDRQVETARLTLPHPGVSQRNFVLYPLHEICPEFVLPRGETLHDLVSACDPTGIERLDDE